LFDLYGLGNVGEMLQALRPEGHGHGYDLAHYLDGMSATLATMEYVKLFSILCIWKGRERQVFIPGTSDMSDEVCCILRVISSLSPLSLSLQT
jgi:hypothetical protein